LIEFKEIKDLNLKVKLSGFKDGYDIENLKDIKTQ
jgi:hypothetical protein